LAACRQKCPRYTIVFTRKAPSLNQRLKNAGNSHKMGRMAKKTGMSDASLWVLALVLILVAAWTYFKK